MTCVRRVYPCLGLFKSVLWSGSRLTQIRDCARLSLLIYIVVFFLFKQKTAYEMRISDWSSDVCSSDLVGLERRRQPARHSERQWLRHFARSSDRCDGRAHRCDDAQRDVPPRCSLWARDDVHRRRAGARGDLRALIAERTEEHTAELQSLMRNAYAVLCFAKTHKY